jgi:hypothetical protein
MGLQPTRRPKPQAYPATLEAAKPRNQEAFGAEYSSSQAVTTHAYLNVESTIGKEVLALARFAGRVRADHRYNALPHYDEQGGYSDSEIENWGFTGCPPGGEKAPWYSNQTPDDKYLVVCESAVDCPSHNAHYR